MGREPGQGRSSEPMPPRKPLDQHKVQLSVTVDRDHRVWLRENFVGLGFRSESHAVDEAIGLLKQKSEADKSSQRGNGSKSTRSDTS
jgi:hypothetical protein